MSKIQSVLNKVEREIVEQTQKKRLSELRGEKLKSFIVRSREIIGKYETQLKTGVREAKREGKKMRNETRYREKLVHLKKAYQALTSHLKDARQAPAEVMAEVREKKAAQSANPRVAQMEAAGNSGGLNAEFADKKTNLQGKRKALRLRAANQQRINGQSGAEGRRRQGEIDHAHAVARGAVKGS